ncbi:PREDICTED: FAS-associated factor 1-like [Priapulus caudatus]|uniref:FAS-associated factor 1-like n=1 Tax=Priapulus caudatus TaxID=37621 RepID=A0ABM1EBW1_PRICU|nr:PREDICTED: FAS-associated factor 1-like [Priapulus caudatus]
MAENREEILANFQACTGIEDIGLAIYHLDEANWNLMSAIGHVMPEGSQTFPSEHVQVAPQLEAMQPDVQVMVEAMQPDVQVMVEAVQPDIEVEHIVPAPLAPPLLETLHGPVNFMPTAGPSWTPEQRMLEFTVELRERRVPIVLLDTETVGTIKKILSEQLGVPVDKMNLQGWKRKVADNTVLATLNLPKETQLYCLVPCDYDIPEKTVNLNGEDPEILERLSRDFRLNINDGDTNKQYHLTYPGSKTILEVKTGYYTLTNLTVSKQVWQGWPDESDNNMTLAGSGISFPCHNFTVTRSKAAAEKAQARKQVEVDLTMSDDSETEDFQDATDSFPLEDDMFIAEPVCSRRVQPLIPEEVDDDTEALQSFCREFEARYGEYHPVFFIGSLDDAIREACQVPAKDRKPLAVYIHHDASVLSNVFCAERLCAEAVVHYLSAHFTTWAWDISCESNRTKYGYQASFPEEPDTDCTEPTSIISRLRYATAMSTIERRFLANNPLQVILNWVASKGYPLETYKVLQSWPRRDVTELNAQQSLQELKLYPQEMLTLEER